MDFTQKALEFISSASLLSFTKARESRQLARSWNEVNRGSYGIWYDTRKSALQGFEASYLHLPTFGNVVFTIADDAKEGPWT